MAYEGLQNGDVRAPLALSQAEAREGTTRVLNLPGGQQVVVPVPPGAYNGQEIRLEGQGQPSAYGGLRGALILTIAIPASENTGPRAYQQPGTDSPTEHMQYPSQGASSPGFSTPGSAGQGGPYTPYPPRTSQQSFYADPTQQVYQQGAPYN